MGGDLAIQKRRYTGQGLALEELERGSATGGHMGQPIRQAQLGYRFRG